LQQSKKFYNSILSLKLEISYDFDFELIGIVSNVRSFKLAWLLNADLSVSFYRTEDVELLFIDDSKMTFTHYLFSTENDCYRLIKNKSHLFELTSKPYLLPELKEYDYFLLIENHTQSIDCDKVYEIISQQPQIQYCQRINPAQIKNRENLIF